MNAQDNYGFTDTAITVLRERYLLKDLDTGEQETIPDMFRRVAFCVANGDIQKADRYYDMMMRRDFLPNSPTLMNAGKEGKAGQLSACYVLPVEDSMEGIFEALKNMAVIHKSGGGTGFNFSNLRHKGARVGTTNGLASGPVSFMSLFDQATECVMQGGMRRGANMGILNIDHPDIMEFVTAKGTGQLTNFNLSVGMTDEFMEGVIQGDLTDEQWDLWRTIVRNAWKSGDPGLVFIDTVNEANHAPQLGDIVATNPCLRGNMKILTDKGYIPIAELIGKKVKVWNGFEWSEVEPRVTGHNQPMLRVTFSNGSVIDCTPYHAFRLNDNSIVEAKALKRNDVLCDFEYPVINTVNDCPQPLDYMYCAGFFVGDGYKGHMESNTAIVDLYSVKQELLQYFKPYAITYYKVKDADKTRVRLVHEYCWDKHFVPSVEYSVSERLTYLAGLIDADGTRLESGGSIGITNADYTLLCDVRNMLNTLGCPANLALEHKEADKMLPDGHGDLKLYHCRATYRLSISAWNINKLIRLGLKTHRVDIKSNPQRQCKRKVRVTSVVECESAETVYCLTEPRRHLMIVEGVVTRQCGECPMHSFEACNLGSINLSNFVEESPYYYYTPHTYQFEGRYIDLDRLAYTVTQAVEFLNGVIDANHYPLPEIESRVKELRTIGLGVMGWADTLNKLGIRYGSEESFKLADFLMSYINGRAHDASKGRNAAVTCIAPTGTISLIAGCSSGIEPLFALEYDRVAFDKDADADGTSHRKVLHYVDPNYQEALEAQDIRLSDGVFVTANEVTWKEHIDMLATFQKYTDLAVSKTINMPNSATVDDVSEAYIYAWQRGCKGITIFRDGCLGTQVLYRKDPESAPEEVGVEGDVCPECGSTSIVRESGCKKCTACGWSPCAI